MLDSALLHLVLCAIIAVNLLITSSPQETGNTPAFKGAGMRRLHTRRAHEAIRCFRQLTYGNGPLCAMFQYATKRKSFRVMETVRGVDCVALEP
jgi:hypothetical protein